MLWCYCFQSHWIMLTWCQCYFFVKHFLLLWGNAVIVFKVPGMESNSRSWQADSDTLIMPEIGSYFLLARFVIFFETIGCAHRLAWKLMSCSKSLSCNIFLALSNYWLCIYLAHRWTHSILCLIPNWSDLPSSSTLTISRSLPRWASEPAILQMEHILGFQFFSNAFSYRVGITF